MEPLVLAEQVWLVSSDICLLCQQLQPEGVPGVHTHMVDFAEAYSDGAGTRDRADMTHSKTADAQQQPKISGPALLRLARKQRSPKSGSPPLSNRPAISLPHTQMTF